MASARSYESEDEMAERAGQDMAQDTAAQRVRRTVAWVWRDPARRALSGALLAIFSLRAGVEARAAGLAEVEKGAAV
jgi:hypothetical protein